MILFRIGPKTDGEKSTGRVIAAMQRPNTIRESKYLESRSNYITRSYRMERPKSQAKVNMLRASLR